MLIKTEREACGYGWVCFDDDAYDGPGSALGFGKTADEAYREFLLKLWDRGERHHTTELSALMRAEFGSEDDGWAEELDPDRLRDDRIERDRLAKEG